MLHRLWPGHVGLRHEPAVGQCIDRDIVQARHHQIRPRRPQEGRVAVPGDAERHHAARAGRRDAGRGVLDDEAVVRVQCAAPTPR